MHMVILITDINFNEFRIKKYAKNEFLLVNSVARRERVKLLIIFGIWERDECSNFNSYFYYNYVRYLNIIHLIV